MATKLKRNFSPEVRLEAAQLVVDQHYTVREAAETMNLGIRAWINGVVSYAKSVVASALKQRS